MPAPTPTFRTVVAILVTFKLNCQLIRFLILILLWSALHRSVMSLNRAVFDLLLDQPKLSLDLRNKNHLTSFAIALNKLNEDEYFALQLVGKGCSLDSVNPETSESLLHSSARNGNEKAGLFLTANGAKINLTNNRGETALHIGITHE